MKESPTGTVTGGVTVEEPRCRGCGRVVVMTREEIADTLADALEITDRNSQHPRRVTETAERLGYLAGTARVCVRLLRGYCAGCVADLEP